MQRYLRFAAAGTQFAVVITLFTLGGVWLDSKVERFRPLFTILGALLGMAGATAALVLQVFGSKKS